MRVSLKLGPMRECLPFPNANMKLRQLSKRMRGLAAGWLLSCVPLGRNMLAQCQ